MIRIELENFLGFHFFLNRHGVDSLLHLDGYISVYRHAHRIRFQSLRKPYFLDSSTEHLCHFRQHFLVFTGLLLKLFLFLFGFLQTQILAGCGTEFFFLIGTDHTDQEVIHLICHVENLITFVKKQFDLRKLFDLVDRRSCRIIDIFLIFLHSGDVFFQRHELLFTGRIEQEEILKFFLQLAEAVVKAEFKRKPEIFKEILVFLS